MNHHDAQRGFTLIELMVASAALMILSLIVTQLTITGQDAHHYSTRLGRIGEVSQRALDDMRRDVRVAVRLFGDDALGQAYRDRLRPWFGYEPIASSRLPTIQSAEGFRKDEAASQKTGNELLFARFAWSDPFECTSGRSYRIDVHRLERIYLRIEGSRPGLPGGELNLCVWTSEPLASATQIDLIADATDRREVLQHLLDASPDSADDVHEPVSVVWRFAEDPGATGTFRQILADGSLSDTPEAPRASTWWVEQSERHSTPGMLFPNELAVAKNGTQFSHGLCRFAIQDDAAGSGAGFPHGLEFQVVGPSAARKVLVHLTTVSTNRKGLKAQFDIQVVINVREG